MTRNRALATTFLALHHRGAPLLMPNPWDVGSAKVLETSGFEALATTSSGFAASLGRLDGAVTLDEVLLHAEQLVEATTIPISADFENGFADDPETVAANVRRAIDTGLAGCSIEDFSCGVDGEIYEASLASERVEAATSAAHRGGATFVITARCENHIRGVDDFDDTVARLVSYQQAGADVLFAPGINGADAIGRLVDAVDLPLNVLAGPTTPDVAALSELGVSRISVGGSFNLVALDALSKAATELRERGTYGYSDQAKAGMSVRNRAFG